MVAIGFPSIDKTLETTGDRGSALARRPDVVMFGRDGIGDALAVVERRLVEASQSGQRQWMLEAARRTDASLSDLTALLSGEVDITHTMNLAKALMAIDPYEWQRQPAPPSPPSFEQRWPDDSWVAIRLALLPWPLDHVQIPTDPAIVRRLSAGDTASPCDGFAAASCRGIALSFSIPVGNPDAPVGAPCFPFLYRRHAIGTALRSGFNYGVIHDVDFRPLTLQVALSIPLAHYKAVDSTTGFPASERLRPDSEERACWWKAREAWPTDWN